VNYRLAPENKFPAAVHDVLDALDWTYKNIESYGGDKSHIYISGESAGGNLAISLVAINSQTKVLNKYRKPIKIAGLFVAYPCVEYNGSYRSNREYKDFAGFLTLDQMNHFWNLYFNDTKKDALNYLAAPIHIPSDLLAKFPPTLFVLAKYDILFDEGLKFSERLRENKIDVKVLSYNNTVHGFFGKNGFGPGIKAVDDVVLYMKTRTEK
jgi:acetyl esterase